MTPNHLAVYVSRDGRLTQDGLMLLQAQGRAIADLQGQLAAIAAVVAPSGGATVDAEARAAIAGIIAASA